MSNALKDQPLSYSDIDDKLDIYVRASKIGQEIFDPLAKAANIDSFEAKRLQLKIATNKDRIERISAAFNRNYSMKKDFIFSKTSVPVMQLDVAKRRAEEISKIIRQIA